MSTAARARYAKIDKLVEALLSDLSASDVPPIPLEPMVRSRGITLRKAKLDEDVSGLLVRTGGSATIGVNAAHPSLRQRFTIAHEFGHFLLHEGIIEHVDHRYRVNYRDQQSALARDVEEIEANYFAASLLMPARLLDQCGALNVLDDDRMVQALAARFQVSRHAMSLRLANLYRRHVPF